MPLSAGSSEHDAKRAKSQEYAAHVALKKKQAKQRKAVRRKARIKAGLSRFARTFYAWLTMALCLFAFVASVSMVVSYQWAQNSDKTTAQWNSLSLLGQNCTCDNLHESYCAESSDAFQGTSYLSVAVLVCEFLIGIVLTWELASYGVYGGTHDTTRLCLLFSLVAMATQMLSLVAFHSAYSGKHCGDASFEENGHTIGWTFYYRAGELFLMVLYVLFTLRAFSTSTRGPPTGALLMMVVLMGLTGVSTQAHGWMSSSISPSTTQATVSFSTWESCTCGSFCDSSIDDAMNSALVCLILQAVFSVFASFFSSLRAVDNEGLTVKYNILFCTLALICGIILSYFFMDSISLAGETLCDNTTKTFEHAWTLQLQIAVMVALFFGIIINAIYLKPTVLIINGKEVSLQEPVVSGTDNNNAATAAADTIDYDDALAVSQEQQQTQIQEQQQVAATLPKILLYHTWWWFQLKDPRTVSHERRAGEESDLEESDSEDDEEEEGEFNGGKPTRGGGGKEPFTDTKSSSRKSTAWSQGDPRNNGTNNVEED